MDPQSWLFTIIRIVREAHQVDWQFSEFRDAMARLEAAFEALHLWLVGGGYPPAASGPVFGRGYTPQWYPGSGGPTRSGRQAPQVPIVHVRSQMAAWRFAIAPQDRTGVDLTRWVFEAYTAQGNVENVWGLYPRYICPTCCREYTGAASEYPLLCPRCRETPVSSPFSFEEIWSADADPPQVPPQQPGVTAIDPLLGEEERPIRRTPTPREVSELETGRAGGFGGTFGCSEFELLAACIVQYLARTTNDWNTEINFYAATSGLTNNRRDMCNDHPDHGHGSTFRQLFIGPDNLLTYEFIDRVTRRHLEF